MAQIPGDYHSDRPTFQLTEVMKAGGAIDEGDLVYLSTDDGVVTVKQVAADGDNWDGVALHTAASGKSVRFVVKGYVPKLHCSGSVVVGSPLDSNGSVDAGEATVTTGVARMKALTAISSGFCEAWIK